MGRKQKVICKSSRNEQTTHLLRMVENLPFEVSYYLCLNKHITFLEFLGI